MKAGGFTDSSPRGGLSALSRRESCPGPRSERRKPRHCEDCGNCRGQETLSSTPRLDGGIGGGPPLGPRAVVDRRIAPAETVKCQRQHAGRHARATGAGDRGGVEPGRGAELEALGRSQPPGIVDKIGVGRITSPPACGPPTACPRASRGSRPRPRNVPPTSRRECRRRPVRQFSQFFKVLTIPGAVERSAMAAISLRSWATIGPSSTGSRRLSKQVDPEEKSGSKPRSVSRK